METNIPIEENTGEAAWPLRRVGLRVQNLSGSVDYYTRLGLAIVRDERRQGQDGSVGLGVGGREILQLRPLPGGRVRPAHTAGLFHFALLVADESELGSFLQHCLDLRIPVGGASDHIVSEALYLSDPEGNGIEVYVDRPREQWTYRNGAVQMDTLPLDVQRLLKLAQPFVGFSDRLRLGHMHLNVGNLERSTPFYQQLGMKLMVSYGSQANFLSWDGYHHHLGLNIWAGRNVQAVQPDVYGLDFYEIRRPELASARLQDLDGVTVIVL